jgi:8-oxo-dGTP pyrophosphatase MutT (NUDIX family)
VFRRFADGPKYLLILDGHGNWGFPKGHTETGESAEQAARREIQEETGLTELTLHAALPALEWTFRSGRTLVRKRCNYFLFECAVGETRPQRDEGITRCTWFSCRDTMQHLTFANTSKLLEKAAAIVDRLSPSAAAADHR